MNAQTLAILLAADDPVEWEAPEGWLQKSPGARQRVRDAACDLNRALGGRFEADSQIQDASFFVQLAALASDGDRGQKCAVAIRFSAFGDLFTTWLWDRSLVPESDLARIISIVESHAFVYVESESLGEPYSGSHPGFREATWWTRFFDYV